MPRIAVVGSCITRDLWPIRGGGAEALAYISRTSFATLFTGPVEGFVPLEPPPNGLHGNEHRALVADLQKTALNRLLTFQPTHFIFDFIDDRYDLFSVGQSVVVNSDELGRSDYLQQPAFEARRPIPRLSAACERLWQDGAAQFAALIRATPLRDAELILHSARWATHKRSPDRADAPLENVEIYGERPVSIAAYNDLLARQEAAFKAVMPPMAVVAAADCRIAEAEHRWGLSPFHYVPAYYDEIRRQLVALGLEEAFPS